MTKARLNRLLASDGKCLDVAIDHGFFNEPGFLTGIEDMRQAVAAIVAAGPDAIQLAPGLAHLLQRVPGPQKPSLVLRTDIANIYGRDLPAHLFSVMIGSPVDQAVMLDAACLCINLLLLPDQPEVHRACVENICRVKPLADAAGMPLMIEPLVMRDHAEAGGYMVDGDLESIRTLVRQAVELGADVVKADPTDDIQQYHRVVEAASGTPILVRGGGKVPDRDILSRTAAIMAQGASGIVYGRNIIQHDKPAAITRALMAIVHQGLSPEAALELLA